MADKILCPWCGAEMFHPRPWQKGTPDMGGYNWTVQAKCRECGAFSPKVYGRRRQEAENKLFVTALRRYTPPLKPMTLEEVFALSHDENEILWLEYHDEQAIRKGLCGYYEPEYVLAYSPIQGNKPEVNFYRAGVEMGNAPDPAVYGIGWRCWSRKPTAEERSAAEWET